METLSPYNLVLEHREGKKHQNADSMSRRDYDKSMCPYYEGGVEPDSLQCGGCELCKSLFNEWKDFQKRIDNVTDLDFGRENKGFLGAIALALNSPAKCRTVTRSQTNQNICSDQNPGIRGSNWSGQYTDQETNSLQKEDIDLSILHNWIDCNKIPYKDAIASHSPAVRKYIG